MTTDFRYQADMGFSRSELLKGLETAVHPYQVKSLSANPIEIFMDDRTVRLLTGKDGYRAIASMRIPQLAVTLEFSGFSQLQYDQFMDRFRKYLHKGGG